MIVTFPDGSRVRGSSIADRRVDDAERWFGLYLDARWQPSWAADLIAWPDFGLPADDDKTIRAVSHVFELMEMAWHDCYAEISPSEDVVDDVLLCSGGTIGGLVTAAHLAVIDRRDLSVWASDLRSDAGAQPELAARLDSDVRG